MSSRPCRTILHYGLKCLLHQRRVRLRSCCSEPRQHMLWMFATIVRSEAEGMRATDLPFSLGLSASQHVEGKASKRIVKNQKKKKNPFLHVMSSSVCSHRSILNKLRLWLHWEGVDEEDRFFWLLFGRRHRLLPVVSVTFICLYLQKSYSKQAPTLLSNKGSFLGGNPIAIFRKSKLPVPTLMGMPMTIDAVTPSTASTFPSAAASNK